jgi:hypothetical protein
MGVGGVLRAVPRACEGPVPNVHTQQGRQAPAHGVRHACSRRTPCRPTPSQIAQRRAAAAAEIERVRVRAVGRARGAGARSPRALPSCVRSTALPQGAPHTAPPSPAVLHPAPAAAAQPWRRGARTARKQQRQPLTPPHPPPPSSILPLQRQHSRGVAGRAQRASSSGGGGGGARASTGADAAAGAPPADAAEAAASGAAADEAQGGPRSQWLRHRGVPQVGARGRAGKGPYARRVLGLVLTTQQRPRTPLRDCTLAHPCTRPLPSAHSPQPPDRLRSTAASAGPPAPRSSPCRLLKAGQHRPPELGCC